MPNPLYLVGAPIADAGNLTLRARRTLTEVTCVAACDLEWARQLLAHLGLRPPLYPAGEQGRVLAALDQGAVALLFSEELPGLCAAGLALVRTAIDRGIPLLAVPGPILPVTALVVSGLPADSFGFLGRLPEQAAARRSLLDAVASEHRTLIAVEAPGRLASALADLLAAFGDRPVVISEPESGWIWRGTLATVVQDGPPDLLPRRCVLVVGGARVKEATWDEDRIRAEVVARLEQGLRAKEIGRQLAVGSGWSRREIYRLAVEEAGSLADDRKETG